MPLVSLYFDTSGLSEELHDLASLMTLEFPEDVSDAVISEFLKLSDDLILGDGVVTSQTDGSFKVIYRPRFGIGLERLASTLRTPKRNGHARQYMLVHAHEGELGMERSMDLIRELLLKVEANPEMDGRTHFFYDSPEQMGIEGHSVKEVAYQIRLLIQDGYLEGKIDVGSPLHQISALTWKGHEFLDNIRDNGIWNQTKKRLGGLPSIALSVIAQIAEAEVKKHVGLS